MKDEINIMDINDGEYIRTKNGTIAKVEDTEFDIKVNSFGQVLYEIDVSREHWYEVIVKHSPNIIDLIEVGDILEFNGEKYEVIFDESYEKLGVLRPNRKELAIRHTALIYIFHQYKEVRILTKEQWNQNVYKIPE